MREAWELLTAGPDDAERRVLLLPGGANAARSFDLVMAEPALAGVRLVATTLPGMAGAPVVGDVSVPGLARRAGELAKLHRCDVVVGFSRMLCAQNFVPPWNMKALLSGQKSGS